MDRFPSASLAVNQEVRVERQQPASCRHRAHRFRHCQGGTGSGPDWQQLLADGVVGSGSEIAQREGLHHSKVNELLRLALLEPAIVQTVLAGQQPRCMSLLWFQRNPLPTDWVTPRTVVAGSDA